MRILDGLLMNDAGRGVREQYAGTGGFTDHVFAVTMLLGYQFIPRIRDLPSKRLHVFDPGAVPNELRALIGSEVRESLIASNWTDVLRSAATEEGAQLDAEPGVGPGSRCHAGLTKGG